MKYSLSIVTQAHKIISKSRSLHVKGEYTRTLQG